MADTGRDIDLNVTRVFEKLWSTIASGAPRHIIMPGGTRSSKTWSVLQALVMMCLHSGAHVDIIRAELSTISRTVQLDLEEILQDLGIYSESMHNKTKNTYQIGTGKIRLMGCDQEDRLRGAKRDIAYINEANEVSDEAAKQIEFRTTEFLICDFNPTFEFRNMWIDDYIDEDDYEVIRSTYKDNPFLTSATVKAIENLIPVYQQADGTKVPDPDLSYDGDGTLVKGSPRDWSIYGKGEYRKNPRLILPHYKETIIEPPFHAIGVDFGYSSPMAAVGLRRFGVPNQNPRAEFKELYYKTGQDTSDLIESLKRFKGVPIFCDSAEPDRIKQMRKAGLDARKARKKVEAGLDALRQHTIWLDAHSPNLLAEAEEYKRQKGSDKPVKENDHIMDAARYALLSLTTGDDDRSFATTMRILNR